MITLRAMSDVEFEHFKTTFTADWAQDLAMVEALTDTSARVEAAARMSKDLPLGLATPGHQLFVVVLPPTDERVGTLWVSVDAQTGCAFLEDITLDAPSRGRGYGRRALARLESQLAEAGVRRLSLHVYAHNPRARALYEAAGYDVTGVSMQKRLEH